MFIDSILKYISPVNTTLLYSETYPYMDNLYTDRARHNAEEGWKQLTLNEKRDFIYYNTYAFIPNQPDNPYKFSLY